MCEIAGICITPGNASSHRRHNLNLRSSPKLRLSFSWLAIILTSERRLRSASTNPAVCVRTRAWCECVNYNLLFCLFSQHSSTARSFECGHARTLMTLLMIVHRSTYMRSLKQDCNAQPAHHITPQGPGSPSAFFTHMHTCTHVMPVCGRAWGVVQTQLFCSQISSSHRTH